MTPLANKVRDFINKCTSTNDAWVTKEHIIKAAMKTGVTRLDILGALPLVHKMGDVQSKTHGETIVYRIRRLAPPKAPPPAHYEPTEEERKEWDTILQDYIDHCPFVSDRERTLMRTPWKEWTDDDHEYMDTGVAYNIYMERKYTPMKYKRMKEERALSGMI